MLVSIFLSLTLSAKFSGDLEIVIILKSFSIFSLIITKQVRNQMPKKPVPPVTNTVFPLKLFILIPDRSMLCRASFSIS